MSQSAIGTSSAHNAHTHPPPTRTYSSPNHPTYLWGSGPELGLGFANEPSASAATWDDAHKVNDRLLLQRRVHTRADSLCEPGVCAHLLRNRRIL